MRGLHRRVEPASARSADAGFTLIEVVVAIALIGGALLTVLAAATSGFAFQSMARQRQSAVAVANKVIEEMRARPYAQVVLPQTVTSADLHSRKCRKNTVRLIACTSDGVNAGSGEPLVNRSTGPVTLNAIQFTWTAYLSRLSPSSPYRLTVFTDWTWRGRAYNVNVQTMLWSPDGCNGSGTHPVSGPCSGGQSLTASSAGLKITVSTVGLTPETTIQEVLGSAGVSYNAEQSLRVTGTYSVPDTASATGSVEADNDTTNAISHQSVEISSTATTQVLRTSTSFTYGSGTWTLSSKYSSTPSTVGKTRAGVTEANVTGTCTTTGATGSPCVGAEVSSSGGSLRIEAACSPCPSKFRSGAKLYLVQITQPWSVIARVSTSGATTTLSSSRTFPEVRFGPVGYWDPTVCSSCGFYWFSYLAPGTQTVSGTVGSEITAPSPPSLSLTTSTPSPSGACQDVQTASTPSGAWAAGSTRCLSAGTYSVAVNGPIEYRFSNMTYTPATTGAGQLTGATFAYDVAVQYCSATAKVRGVDTCTAWSVISPTFRVVVESPTLKVSGGSTAW